jgi:predicted outer membrane repeat protein
MRRPPLSSSSFLAAIAALLLWASVISAYTATITVTTKNDSGPGSLRQALAIANDGDTIMFAVTGSIVLTSGELVVDTSITISGPGADKLAVDGNASSRVFHIASGKTVSITDLTITNGIASGNRPAGEGGGIYNDHAALALNKCTITSNRAGFGGGIYNDASSSGYASLTISSSMLTGNSARFGGAIYNDGFDSGDATLTVNNSTFSGNSADFGGGIFNDSFGGSASLALSDSTFSGNSADNTGGCIYNDIASGYGKQALNNSSLSGNSAGSSGGAIYSNHGVSFTLNNCAISGNSAQNWGGGIYNDGSQKGAAWLTISSSTLDGNSAATGGGIFNDGEQGGDTHLQISNSTISENTATYGGAIASDGYYGFYVSVQINNSTFSGNSASNVGGGIYIVGEGSQDVIVSLANTILKTGAAGDNIFNDSGTVSSLGYNLSNDTCGGFLTGPGDLTNTEPMLGPLRDNGGPTLTHALLPGSPAIDTGDPNFTPPPFYDQRGPGFDRVVNGRIDIGSFEAQAPIPRETPLPRPRPVAKPRPTPR